MKRSWSYLPALDGIRAIAVVAVVLFHFWPDSFPGGFIGVDIFFVMSGYLITSIMAVEHERHGRIDLVSFWGRRIRRLVPAVIALVVICSFAVWITDTGSALFVAHALGALTWTTNLTASFTGDVPVFASNSNTVLDHLWSLAIEEQFYLLWPLGAALLWRYLRTTKSQLIAVGVVMAASVTAMGFAGPVHGYFRTDARAFELLAGAALALSGVTARTIRPALITGASVVGLVGVVALVATVEPSDAWMFPGGFVVVTLVAVCLVTAATQPPRWFGAALEWPPIRHLGQVSYGVYLWHIPVLRILSPTRLGIDNALVLAIIRFAVLAVLVEASYRLIEQPFRNKRFSFGWKGASIGYTLAVAALLLQIPAARDDWAARFDFPDDPPSVAAGETSVLVLGDFSALIIGDTLEREDGLSVWNIADGGCNTVVRPTDSDFTLAFGEPVNVTGFCRHWQQRWTNAAADFEPQVIVLATGYNDTNPIVDASGTPLDLDEMTERHRATLDRAIGDLSDAVDEPTVITLVRVDDWSALVSEGSEWDPDRSEIQAAYNEMLDELAEAHPNVEVLRLEGSPDWAELRSEVTRFADALRD